MIFAPWTEQIGKLYSNGGKCTGKNVYLIMGVGLRNNVQTWIIFRRSAANKVVVKQLRKYATLGHPLFFLLLTTQWNNQWDRHLCYSIYNFFYIWGNMKLISRFVIRQKKTVWLPVEFVLIVICFVLYLNCFALAGSHGWAYISEEQLQSSSCYCCVKLSSCVLYCYA